MYGEVGETEEGEMAGKRKYGEYDNGGRGVWRGAVGGNISKGGGLGGECGGVRGGGVVG